MNLLHAVIFAVGTLGLTGVPVSAAQDAANLTVTVNTEPVAFVGQGPVERGGRVLVPLRGVLERLGANVRYDAPSKTVLATRGDTNITLIVGGSEARINERFVHLETPAQALFGTTLVPLRFVSEALGAQVGWDARTRTVAITTDGSAPAVAASVPTAVTPPPAPAAATPAIFTGEFLEEGDVQGGRRVLKMTDGRTVEVEGDATITYEGQSVGFDDLRSGDLLTITINPRTKRGITIKVADPPS